IARHSNAFEFVWLSEGTDMPGEDICLVQDLLDALDSIEDFNEPGVMLVERTQYNTALQCTELDPFPIGLWRPAPVDNVQSSKRTDTIDTVWITFGLEIRSLYVRVGRDRLTDVALISLWTDLIHHDRFPKHPRIAACRRNVRAEHRPGSLAAAAAVSRDHFTAPTERAPSTVSASNSKHVLSS